jgi:hypothetical protein
MARFVRRLDGGHLVSAGHIGYKTELSRESWQRITGLDAIGYADVHAYPHNVLAVTDPETLGGWLDDRANLALNVLDKPLILGEIGFRRNDRRFSPRDDWFARALERSSADGLSGMMIWIYRSWDERDDPQGVWAEGPFADGTAPVRSALRWAAVEWAGTPPQITNDAVSAAAADTRLFPLGVEHLRPWTEGEWKALDVGRGRVSLDPWALAEGCAVDDRPAWAVYVVDVHREDVPTHLEVLLAPPGEELVHADLEIDVSIDGVVVGTWHGPGRYESAGDDALVDAFAARRTFRYLRLETDTAPGRDYLRLFTAGLPADGTHVFELAWPELTDDDLRGH